MRGTVWSPRRPVCAHECVCMGVTVGCVLPCKNPTLGLYGETVDGELGGVCVLWSRLVVVVAMVVVWVAGVFVCECVCLCVRIRKILCVWV